MKRLNGSWQVGAKILGEGGQRLGDGNLLESATQGAASR